MCEYDWDSNLIWQHEDPGQHHDARRLENGGTVYLANYPLTPDEQNAVKGGGPAPNPTAVRLAR